MFTSVSHYEGIRKNDINNDIIYWYIYLYITYKIWNDVLRNSQYTKFNIKPNAHSNSLQMTKYIVLFFQKIMYSKIM